MEKNTITRERQVSNSVFNVLKTQGSWVKNMNINSPIASSYREYFFSYDKKLESSWKMLHPIE